MVLLLTCKRKLKQCTFEQSHLSGVAVDMQEGAASRGAAAGCQQHVAILQIIVAEAQPARLLCCEDVL